MRRTPTSSRPTVEEPEFERSEVQTNSSGHDVASNDSGGFGQKPPLVADHQPSQQQIQDPTFMERMQQSTDRANRLDGIPPMPQLQSGAGKPEEAIMRPT